MNASPSRCSSGPQNRIGIRLDPACASMSATWALSTLRRVQHQLALGRARLGDRHPVQLEQAGHDARRRGSPGRCADGSAPAQQGGDHRLGDEVLRAADGTRPVSGVPPWTVRTSLTAYILAHDGRPSR